MSMNLHCNQIELRQTPTQITYMCMVQPDGSVSSELTGKKAKHALHIYSEWVKGGLNGVWKDLEDLKLARVLVNEEMVKINKVLESKTKLKVYIL